MKLRGLLLVALALAAAGCKPAPPASKTAAEPTPPPEYFHVDPATAATVHGRVAYRGPKPARERISMDAEAACEQAHTGRPVYDEPIAAAPDGALANAFVYIQSGLEGKTFEPVKTAVTLDQHGCLFVPHIIALRAAQPLDVRNSDEIAHNIHPMPRNNHEWNDSQSPHTPDVEHKFARREVMIPVKCNVHSWMRAYIAVMEHPYFAVTAANGAFLLPNLPPGDYTIAVWHEKLGDQTRQIHVGPSENAAVDFTYQP